MLELYRESLAKDGCFVQEYPQVFKAAAATIPSHIPSKMAILMAAAELTVFAGHLRKPIMWHGSKIPVNMIAFLIGGSGSGKGLSIKCISKILENGNTQIDKSREAYAKVLAVEAAEADGKKPTDWRKYYAKPKSLKSTVSTLPGTMKHLASLEKGKLGSGYMYVDEIGSELVSNKDLSENIIALAIGYDLGEIAPKLLKDDTNQVEAIHNLPYSALMFGSPANIIYDEVVKKKFKDEFSTKLSRRVHFAFITEKEEKPVFDSIAESRLHAKTERDRVAEATAGLAPWFTSLVTTTTHIPLAVTEEVEDLFSDYQGYNDWYAETISKQYPMTILHRLHLQWKSLKIAGALAILSGDTVITKQHMVEAIRFSEIFANDLMAFETELSKEPYELLVSYMHSIAVGGTATVSIHQLRKLGFITGQGSDRKAIELVDLANNLDTSKYEVIGKYIHFFQDVGDTSYDRDTLA